MTFQEVMQNFDFLSNEDKDLLNAAGFHDGHVDNFKILEHLIIKGRFDGVKSSIENGMSVDLAESNGMGSSLLQMSIRYKQDEIFDYLIEQGANINFIDLVGWTPLMEAIIDDNVVLAKRLVDLGADLSIANKRGATAPMLAQKFGKLDILAFLS